MAVFRVEKERLRNTKMRLSVELRMLFCPHLKHALVSLLLTSHYRDSPIIGQYFIITIKIDLPRLHELSLVSVSIQLQIKRVLSTFSWELM